MNAWAGNSPWNRTFRLKTDRRTDLPYWNCRRKSGRVAAPGMGRRNLPGRNPEIRNLISLLLKLTGSIRDFQSTDISGASGIPRQYGLRYRNEHQVRSVPELRRDGKAQNHPRIGAADRSSIFKAAADTKPAAGKKTEKGETAHENIP